MPSALRVNPKVVVLERKNARYLTEEDVPEQVDLMVSDVSFISLLKVIPPNLRFMKEEGLAVLLFKPQFELAAEDLGKNGIPLEQEKVISRMEEVVLGMRESGLFVRGAAKSPLKGNSGNTEYLLLGTMRETEIIGRGYIEECVLRT